MKYINYIISIGIFLSVCTMNARSQGCVNFSSNKVTVAAGSTVTFQDLSQATCPTCPPTADQKMYTWTFDDNGNYEGITPASSDSMGPTVRYDSIGTYDVYLNVLYNDGMGGFCLDTNNKITKVGYVTVVPAPTAAPQVDFSADVTYGESGLVVTFTDMSTNSPESWEWTFPGGNPVTSNEQNPVVVYNGVGTYDVLLDATNVVGTNSLTKNDYISVFGVGIKEELASKISLNISPIPFNDYINIQYDILAPNIKMVLELYNELGEKVITVDQEKYFNTNKYQKQINLNTYPQGVYFLKLVIDGQVYNIYRIIKF